ncbi:hypothetical protein P7C70_g4402, partial [Phenoliferia sp. Uapishka_3]
MDHAAEDGPPSPVRRQPHSRPGEDLPPDPRSSAASTLRRTLSPGATSEGPSEENEAEEREILEETRTGTSQVDDNHFSGPSESSTLEGQSRVSVLHLDKVHNSVTESQICGLFEQYGTIHGVDLSAPIPGKPRKKDRRTAKIYFSVAVNLEEVKRRHNLTVTPGTAQFKIRNPGPSGGVIVRDSDEWRKLLGSPADGSTFTTESMRHTAKSLFINTGGSQVLEPSGTSNASSSPIPPPRYLPPLGPATSLLFAEYYAPCPLPSSPKHASTSSPVTTTASSASTSIPKTPQSPQSATKRRKSQQSPPSSPLFNTRPSDSTFLAQTGSPSNTSSLLFGSPPSKVKKTLQSQVGNLVPIPTRVVKKICMSPPKPPTFALPSTHPSPAHQSSASSSTIPSVLSKPTREPTEAGQPVGKRRRLLESGTERLSTTSGTFDTNPRCHPAAGPPQEAIPAMVNSSSPRKEKPPSGPCGSSTTLEASETSASDFTTSPSKICVPRPAPSASAGGSSRLPSLGTSSAPFIVILLRFLTNISPALVPHSRLLLALGLKDEPCLLNLLVCSREDLGKFVEVLNVVDSVEEGGGHRHHKTVGPPVRLGEVFLAGIDRMKEELTPEIEALESALHRKFCN